MNEPATVVLVHGGWSGGWVWEKVIPLLEREGIPTVAPDLPTVALAPDQLVDVSADAAVVRDVLDGLDGPAVLVGHSYSGSVITEAAIDHPAVRHLVYIDALVPDAGEAPQELFLSVQPEPPMKEFGEAMANSFREDGTFFVDPAIARTILSGWCSPEDVESYVSRMRPMSQGAAFGHSMSGAAWRTIPSTFVSCTRSETVSPAAADFFAARTTHRVDWDTGHNPMWYAPQLVADLLVRLARECGTSGASDQRSEQEASR